jgi:hypothetical protein
MKTSTGKGDAPGTIKEGGADSAITDELRAIDDAPLDQLLEIRTEETRLEEYRQRAGQRKEQVQEAVWRRVVDDYAKRIAALEREAAPLRDQVRHEYQKLRVLLDRASGLRTAAELEKAELEFRHEVGELTDAELKDRLHGPAQTLDQCATDLAIIEERKARFLSAFASEADLDLPAEDRTPAAGLVADSSGPATTRAPVAAGPSASAAGRTAAIDADVTILPSRGIATAGASAGLPPEADATGLVAEPTFMLPVAGLSISEGGGTPRECLLGATNYIGRSSGSQVMITRPGVSRKHAIIAATADGFTISDLGSQNGTLVNGERITEHALKNGDQIVIADATLTFVMPWSPGRGANG